ncbi:MAG: 2TM domain-containing protein [Alphaproteobacteria bacterium]
MTHDPKDDAERRYIRRRVRGLRHHVLVYLCVMAGLALVGVLGGHAQWVLLPAIGWGIGVLAHAVGVFGIDVGREWEDRLVDHLMARRRRQGLRPAPPPGTDDHPSPPPL